jgi:PPK2 family polyphosphate:nucleotide phosphotransferase
MAAPTGRAGGAYRCRMASTRKQHLGEILRVKPGSRFDVTKLDPGETHGYRKDDVAPKLEKDIGRLTVLQERLWAEHKQRLLIVLQGMDASGKDGTIKHVMSGLHPLGCRVIGFGVPSATELAHDYLWRVHEVVPGDGEVAIFNRSHYEDVLVVRVHDLVPKERWSKRYAQINAFETLLADEGTTILKFFLHISKKEQKKRLQDRLDDPSKHWKFDLHDLDVRKQWDQYTAAYEDALSRCSTDYAPWYAIPSDHKWYRNWAISDVIVRTLEKIKPQFPKAKLPKDLKIE